MQTKAEKEVYLSMIRTGQLDIIVGTHALLGSRVVYNNLGLLVVDEEQVYAPLLFNFTLINFYFLGGHSGSLLSMLIFTSLAKFFHASTIHSRL